MDHKNSELYFLLVFLSGIFVLAFFIFKPLLFTLILAIVFATVFGPIHKRALVITHERRGLAALLAIGAVIVIIVVPITFLGIQIFQEATGLYALLTQSGSAADLSRGIGSVVDGLEKIIPVPIELSFDINKYLEQGSNWLIQHLGSLFSNIAKIVMNAFVFLVALYYLFKDGPKLKSAIIALSPLQDVHDQEIFNKLASAINSVIRGNLAVALVQGVLAAVGFAIFGISNVVLWGGAAAITALIPGIGTALVITPVVLFLLITGETFSAGGLLIWGMTAVGLIDNFLGPKLVGRGARLHPFLVLLSVLGGLSFFGPLGFLFGPLVLSLLFALFEIYLSIRKGHDKIV